MKRTRALLSLLPLTLVATLLSSCSSGGDEGDTGDSGLQAGQCAPEGEVSRSLEFSGEFGESLTLASATPVSVDSLERSVLIEGDGDEIGAGDLVEMRMTIINGTNGETLESSLGELENSAERLAPWALQALACSSTGDRVAVAVPVPDVLGEGNAASRGLEESDSFVIALDLLKPCGPLTPRDEQYPEIELGDGTSEPQITIPRCMEEPTELEVTTLVEGDGAVVQEGDTVSFDYVGMFWQTGEVFDSSWSRGQLLELPTTQVIAGFSQAMVGQKVGSTVLSVVPDELGYSDGLGVRVFVIDIREVVPAE